MKIKNAILLSLLFLLLVCVPGLGYCTDTTTGQQPQTVTMQLSQYNRLKEITNEQEMTLTSLKTSIEILKQNSTADKQTLLQLNSQLADCQTRLTNAQQLLNQQSSKLTEASSLLAKNAESLQTLRTQIQALEHKLAVIKRQRDAWAVLAGGLVGYIAFDKISKK